nr:aminoacetone oxidase family FAD-binding enzyme [bacterium]
RAEDTGIRQGALQLHEPKRAGIRLPSENPHFVKSALARLSPNDIVEFMDRKGVAWVEEEYGKLFCRRSSRDLLSAMVEECKKAGAIILTGTKVDSVERVGRDPSRFFYSVTTNRGFFEAPSVVVATGGLSRQELGASDLGYRIAREFGIRISPPRPALVPLLWNAGCRRRFGSLSGISLDARVRIARGSFGGGVLFTHRGLSGPAILDASLFRRPGEKIVVEILPEGEARPFLRKMRTERPRAELKTVLAARIPRRFAEAWCEASAPSRPMRSLKDRELNIIAGKLSRWEIAPAGSEGFASAEVTSGGVDTKEISSKTMEAKGAPGLFFAGEVLDVAGRIGGYNLHWAWASGNAAGLVI